MDGLKIQPDSTVRLRFVSDVEKFIKAFYAPTKRYYSLPTDYVYKETEDFRPGVRFLCYVVDRTDPKNQVVKKAELGWSVVKAISELAKDTDDTFTDYPDYDMKIKKEGKGKMTSYSVLPTDRNRINRRD